MRNKHVVFAIIVTYLVLSFFPGLGLMSILGKGKKG